MKYCLFGSFQKPKFTAEGEKIRGDRSRKDRN